MHSDRDALIDTFLAESEENLVAIEEGLLLLEGRPADADLLHAIFRGAHTLKGNASSLGLERVAEIAHLIEDLLERLRDGRLEADGPLVTLLLRSVDALRHEVPAAIRGEESDAVVLSRVLEELTRFESAPTGASPQGTGPETREATTVKGDDGEPGPQTPRGVSGADARARTLRIGIEKLDRLLDLAGELAIARGRLQQVLEAEDSPQLQRALEIHAEADRVHADLQELVMEARMVSVGPVFRHQVRTVRDQAAALGKRARVLIEGEDVEADTKIIDYMRDPLTHMVRNAVDHGIETPEARTAAGKDPCGTVTLRALHETGSVVFEVSDDGAGLDRAAILERARSRGLAGDEPAKDDEVLGLVFEPGLSTADHVTALSGRGVGLDVVRRQVDVLRGALAIESRPGRGTTIRTCLPLTVAMIPGFSVGVAGETYIVPLDRVVETLELPRDSRPPGPQDGRGVLNLREHATPYVRLRSLFELGGGRPSREHVVVVSNGGGRVGIAVDVLHGEIQAVIKPLGRGLHAVPGIAGSAILGNGRVGLILDVPALLKEAGQAASAVSQDRADEG